jgi:HEAT repeat protein
MLVVDIQVIWRNSPPGETSYEPRTLDEWANELKSRDPDRRFQARRVFMHRGERSVPYLVEALSNRETGVREEAAAGLAGLSTRFSIDDAVPALIAALDDASPHVREEASAALRWAGPRAREAIPALRKAAHDSDRWVRLSAQRTLEEIEHPQPRLVHSLPFILP